MKRLLPLLLAAGLNASAQSIPGPGDDPSRSKPSAPATSAPTAESAKPASAKQNHSDSQASIDRLTKSNQELLDLLHQQQDVLRDMQLDRRLLNRQVMLVEQRLEDSLHANAALESKISRLEADAASAAANPTPAASSDNAPAKTSTPPATVAPAPPPPPASYLPAESTGGAPGTMWWHRIMSLSGEDTEDSKTFHVSGKQWRVLWHNRDKAGTAYKNTSALFINAFPSNDSIPKKVCSQLGTGGDATELTGIGDFYLRIEASGGRWELAVEDFR